MSLIRQRASERDAGGKGRRVWGWLTADGKQVIDGLTKTCPVLPADESSKTKPEPAAPQNGDQARASG